MTIQGGPLRSRLPLYATAAVAALLAAAILRSCA
jgi:hypothetical protein